VEEEEGAWVEGEGFLVGSFRVGFLRRRFFFEGALCRDELGFPFCPSILPPALSSFRGGPTARGRGGGRLRIM